ncbi:hypothetical protein CJ030_MR0G007882 [Morella rubra]|uniref:PGG domain-containing protein n=1 Tax=Morella rubra TaxID=262757 RepID=A0A6A1UIW6_9ROSI|nr:hypothetical protein CJ030_MR0G007882 [Morella rubra]
MPHKQNAELEIFARASHPQRVSPVQELDHGQVDDRARDGSLQALWQLFFQVLPYLSSLLRSFNDWYAARSLRGPNFASPQETSLDAGSPQQECRPIILEEPRLRAYPRDFCAPLLQATLKGDWRAAKAFLKQHPCCVREPITKEQGTALHYAAAAKRTRFVKELLKLMTPSDLELKTTEGWTALCFAAQSEKVRIAQEMVKMNKKLPYLRTNQGATPLQMAASLGRKSMASYLFSVTPFEQLASGERVELFLATISTDLYDIALQILNKDPKLATAEAGYGWKALEEFAKKPDAIGSKSFSGLFNKALLKALGRQLVEGVWKKFEKLSDHEEFSSTSHDNHMVDLLVEATKQGNVEFLILLLRSCNPDLIWQLVDRKRGSLFHIAISYRQESVFTLIHELGTLKDSIANYSLENNNNMLHLAAQLAPSDRLNLISGPALQIQREYLWFKELKKIVPPSHVNEKNSDGETPGDLFIRTHKELRNDAERWIKDKANSCMIVATLIATVVFTAIFTVPGGNNQESGTPIFLESNWFMLFFISNALAFISSSTSILIFLSMLTSRYTEEDFRKWLPMGLVVGLILLFLCILGMVGAFSATCFLVYQSKTIKIPIFITALASVPIILFVLLHYELWLDIIRSAYLSRFLFWQRKRRLF